MFHRHVTYHQIHVARRPGGTFSFVNLRLPLFTPLQKYYPTYVKPPIASVKYCRCEGRTGRPDHAPLCFYTQMLRATILGLAVWSSCSVGTTTSPNFETSKTDLRQTTTKETRPAEAEAASIT